jgi:hypothetical protein
MFMNCNPDHVYTPVVLRCKTPDLARAFCTIITNMGAAKRDLDGSSTPPYVDGDRVVMPWSGHPKFVNNVTTLAMETRVAEPEEVREMSYGAMAQGMDTAVENVRNFGEQLGRLMFEFMQTLGTSRPVDVGSLMDTLDTDLADLQGDGQDD